MLVEEGNKQFAAREWEAAKTQYVAAIKAHPTLAEAHYNLALTLEMMGDQAGAKREYIQAANLAPGHKIIWDSPPLRKHGDIGLETGTTKKDLLEPSKHGPHQ
jgi:tetratricopeptide (TPR) repeat protein